MHGGSTYWDSKWHSAREFRHGSSAREFGHVDFEVSVRVRRREVKWDVGHQSWRDTSHSFSLCATLIMSWVGPDESWEHLRPWHFMMLCSLTFQVGMKESCYLFPRVSPCATSGKRIFLWVDFETYLLWHCSIFIWPLQNEFRCAGKSKAWLTPQASAASWGTGHGKDKPGEAGRSCRARHTITRGSDLTL